MNKKSCQLDPNTTDDTLNTEKQEPWSLIEAQSNCNRNTAHPNSSEQTLIQEEEKKKRNEKTIKKMMSEKKTTLTSLKN